MQVIEKVKVVPEGYNGAGMTSQLEFYRYSKEIAGNLANVVTQYQFR